MCPQLLGIGTPSSTPSTLPSFIAAFVSRLNAGSSLSSIKKSLNKNREIIPTNLLSSSSVIRCRLQPPEPCGHFDPTDLSCFTATATPGHDACSCCVSSPASETPALVSSPIVTETSTPICADFNSFLCRPRQSFTCHDGHCYAELPTARALRPEHTTRSSPVGGGGDAFNVYETFSFGSLSSTSLEEEFESVAIVDSGATLHSMGSRRGLINMRPAHLTTTTADGSQVRISEKGDFVIPSEDAHGNPLDPLILHDVSLMKGSPVNLISVGMLCNEGSTFHFERGNSYFEHHGHRFRLIERDGLYLLKLNDILSSEEMSWLRTTEQHLGHARETEFRSKLGVNYACAATWDLWHERFGHGSKKRLKFLFDNGSVEGMAVDGQKFKHDGKCTCPTCLSVNNAKLHIGDVRKFADSVTRKGELLLTDICGPLPTSVEGYRYVISFTDVYSRFSACYFLRKKSDSEAALEALVAFYKRHGVLIKEIRSDQGGEFGGHHHSPSLSAEGGAAVEEHPLSFFKRVCEKHGIIHTPTPAYRPELHGLAERWNLTVPKMANAMLFSSRISHILWPSAFAHANLLRNRLPLKGLGPYTPFELFFGKRPRVDQLRVWGCDAYKLLPTYPKIPGQQARKRLIYLGETSDRIGFRCFDPITYKFSTEFELIFDEQSARKRINSLYEHDARRALAKQGKLSKLPLIADDFATYDAAQRAVRDVFSSSLPPHQDVGVAGREAVVSPEGAGAPESTTSGAGSSPAYPAVNRPPHEERAPLQSASNQPGNLGRGLPSNSHDISSRQGPTVLPEGTSSIIAHSPALYPGTARRMGGAAAPERPEHGCKRDTVPTLILEGSEMEDEPEEFKLLGHSLRPGPLPSLRPRKPNVDLVPTLSEQDGASVLLNDTEADMFGPLTAEALEAERKKSQLDPRHPRRPLRLLPQGQIEKDTPEFKAFRKFALDNDILIKLVDNPKQPGTKSYHRYQLYQPASTLRELIELSATSSNPVERRQQIKKAHDDITNDAIRGYILFPQYEHNASAHFVDAGRLARQVGVINIHALYSSAEMDSARAESEALLTTLAAAQEASAEPRSFHDLVRDLWEYDHTLQLNESELRKESAFAAATVNNLLTGDAPEPATFRQVAKHPERDLWLASMARERSTLEERGTWVLVPRESIGRHRPVRCKYVYRKKLLKDGTLQFKSRLVACGYSQVPGVDYSLDDDETMLE